MTVIVSELLLIGSASIRGPQKSAYTKLAEQIKLTINLPEDSSKTDATTARHNRAQIARATTITVFGLLKDIMEECTKAKEARELLLSVSVSDVGVSERARLTRVLITFCRWFGLAIPGLDTPEGELKGSPPLQSLLSTPISGNSSVSTEDGNSSRADSVHSSIQPLSESTSENDMELANGVLNSQCTNRFKITMSLTSKLGEHKTLILTINEVGLLLYRCRRALDPRLCVTSEKRDKYIEKPQYVDVSTKDKNRHCFDVFTKAYVMNIIIGELNREPIKSIVERKVKDHIPSLYEVLSKESELLERELEKLEKLDPYHKEKPSTGMQERDTTDAKTSKSATIVSKPPEKQSAVDGEDIESLAPPMTSRFLITPSRDEFFSSPLHTLPDALTDPRSQLQREVLTFMYELFTLDDSKCQFYGSSRDATVNLILHSFTARDAVIAKLIAFIRRGIFGINVDRDIMDIIKPFLRDSSSKYLLFMPKKEVYSPPGDGHCWFHCQTLLLLRIVEARNFMASVSQVDDEAKANLYALLDTMTDHCRENDHLMKDLPKYLQRIDDAIAALDEELASPSYVGGRSFMEDAKKYLQNFRQYVEFPERRVPFAMFFSNNNMPYVFEREKVPVLSFELAQTEMLKRLKGNPFNFDRFMMLSRSNFHWFNEVSIHGAQHHMSSSQPLDVIEFCLTMMYGSAMGFDHRSAHYSIVKIPNGDCCKM